MTIFEEFEKLVNDKFDASYKTLRICKVSERQCIEFANWIQIEGWYYGVNGNYYYQSLGVKLLELTPQELFEFYKLELKK